MLLVWGLEALVNVRDENTTVDQLYAQVDKKKNDFSFVLYASLVSLEGMKQVKT